MRFIFFKGLENVSVCRCVCVHMCSSSARRGGLQDCLHAPGSAVPRMKGWQCLWQWSYRQVGLSNTLHSGNLVHICPCDFQRGDSSSRLLQLCVWHRNPAKAPEAALALWAHTLAEPGSQCCWQSSTSITPECSETAERGLSCLVPVTEGWSKRLGWEMIYLLLKKIISSMHSAAWAGSKVIVHLSLPWASLRTQCQLLFSCL